MAHINGLEDISSGFSYQPYYLFFVFETYDTT